jgi:hypothetical protein
VILAIIVVSMIPTGIELIRAYLHKSKAETAE